MPRNDFLVVIDPTREEQPALERAIQSAAMTGRRLTLLECVNLDYRGDREGTDEEVRRSILSESGSRLAVYMERALAADVDANSVLVWNDDWMGAVVGATVTDTASRQASAHAASLVHHSDRETTAL